MSDTSTAPKETLFDRLPAWARPLEQERRGLGSLRLAETTILILLGLFLTVAVVNDLVEQTHVNHRLVADLSTWRTVTGHDYRNLSVGRDVKGYTTRDTTCGNISPGGPKQRPQICLTLTGSVLGGHRIVSGGYYLPAHSVDERSNRYACFGTAVQSGLCARVAPPAGSPPAPPLPTGRP